VNWAAWICVAVLLAQQTYLVRIATGLPITWLAAFKTTIGGCLLWALFTPAIIRVSRRFRVDSFASVPTVLVHLLIGTVFCAVDAAANLAIAGALGQPRVSFVVGFLRLYPFNITCYLAVVAIVHAVDFARMYRERAVAEAELSAELSTARLRMLESQLRPHFLFNTLNTIAEQVHSNPQGADDMILRLAALLRASLHLTEGHEVPLRDELATVANYLAIVRARYEDRLRVSIDVAPEFGGILVPAMVLQPLVENALQHGVEPIDGVTHVSITAARRGDSLVLTVADDGAGLVNGVVADGVGLRNTRDRLQHLYGDAARLVLRLETPAAW
jgi:signal transduction histidine kinase